MQDHVDEVRCGQALHVLDALLEEAGLVPHAQAIDLVEWIRRVERRHDNAQRGGGEPLDRLHPCQGKEADQEGDGRRGPRIAVRQDLIQPGDKYQHHDETQQCVRVGGGPQIAWKKRRTSICKMNEYAPRKPNFRRIAMGSCMPTPPRT